MSWFPQLERLGERRAIDRRPDAGGQPLGGAEQVDVLADEGGVGLGERLRVGPCLHPARVGHEDQRHRRVLDEVLRPGERAQIAGHERLQRVARGVVDIRPPAFTTTTSISCQLRVEGAVRLPSWGRLMPQAAQSRLARVCGGKGSGANARPVARRLSAASGAGRLPSAAPATTPAPGPGRGRPDGDDDPQERDRGESVAHRSSPARRAQRLSSPGAPRRPESIAGRPASGAPGMRARPSRGPLTAPASRRRVTIHSHERTTPRRPATSRSRGRRSSSTTWPRS